jgi:hypothetical protein
MVAGVARGLQGAALAAVGAGVSVGRHALWYMRYRVDGNASARLKREQARRAARRR